MYGQCVVINDVQLQKKLLKMLEASMKLNLNFLGGRVVQNKNLLWGSMDFSGLYNPGNLGLLVLSCFFLFLA